MSYRDDRDALLARADALEEENRRLRAELEARDQPPRPAPPPEPPPAPEPPRAARRLPPWVPWTAGIVAAVAALVTLMAIMPRDDDDDFTPDPDLAGAPSADATTRWKTLVAIEPCLDGALVDVYYVRQAAPDRTDPRRGGDLGADRTLAEPGNECLDDLDGAARDPLLTSAAPALARLADASRTYAAAAAPLVDYMAHEDWRDDDLAGGLAKWQALAPTFDAWVAALRDARAVAIPAIATVIADAADRRARDHGRDLVWWQLHVGADYRALVEDAIAAVGPDQPTLTGGAALATAVQPEVTRFAAEVAAAPIEVRRAYRDLDDVPQYLGGERDPLEGVWNLIGGEHDILATIDGGDVF